MDHQDFKEVVLTKKRPSGSGTGGGTLKDQRAVANVRLFVCFYFCRDFSFFITPQNVGLLTTTTTTTLPYAFTFLYFKQLDRH